MFDVVILRARHVILTIGVMGIFLSNASGAPNTLTVRDARPVAYLYATIDVQLPKELTPEQRTHFEALQALEKGTKAV